MSDTVRDLLDAINAFEDEHGQDPGYRDVCHGLRDAELSLHRMEAHREGPSSSREGDDAERPKGMKESFKDAHTRAADQYAGHNEADTNDEGEGPNSRNKRRRGAPARREDQ